MNSGYVGFWRRLIAYLFDIFIIGTSFIVLANNFLQISGYDTSNPTFQFLSFGISALYLIFFWSAQDGQTIGNRILKIKVTNENGRPLTFANAVVRYIGLFFSFVILGLGVVWIAFDKKKQGLHDKIARTVVVSTGKPNILLVILTFIALGILYGVMLSGFAYTVIKTNGIPRLGHSDPKTLAANVFAKVNEKRTSANLPILKEDSRLCAYGQRRLEQITQAGGSDDGRGFYEDTANTEISRAYFSENPFSGQMYRQIDAYSKDQEIADGWFNMESSNLKNERFVNGCVRADENDMVLILGGK